MDFFFVLSGFVIPYSIAKTYKRYALSNFPNFFARRMLRLEPPYILSVALVIALWHASAAMPGFRGDQPDYEIIQLLSHLLYAVPLMGHAWLQPVYWTLAYEFVFYCLMGAAFPFIFSDCSKAKFVVYSLGAIGLTLCGALPPISLLFLLGVTLFYHAEFGEVDAHGFRSAPFVALLAVAALVILDEGTPAAAGTVALLAIHVGRKWTLEQVLYRPLLALGAISYSLYLVHVPVGGRVVNLGRRYVSGPWEEFALSVLALAVSIVFAFAFWIAIERPSIRLARKVAARGAYLPAQAEIANVEVSR